MEEKLPRLLNADEIEVRVGQVAKDGSWVSYLLYKDARCDMKRLDEMYGPFGWQRDHKELKGVMYCGISIWDDEKHMFITKWDAGTESNTEAQKGEASDSFKRAAVNWGIGRELYTGPKIFVKTDKLSKGKDSYLEVKEIGYDDNREINHLVLIEPRNSDNVVYTFDKKKGAAKKTTTAAKKMATEAPATPAEAAQVPKPVTPPQSATVNAEAEAVGEKSTGVTPEQARTILRPDAPITPADKTKAYLLANPEVFMWFHNHDYGHAGSVEHLSTVDLNKIWVTIKDRPKFLDWFYTTYKL